MTHETTLLIMEAEEHLKRSRNAELPWSQHGFLTTAIDRIVEARSRIQLLPSTPVEKLNAARFCEYDEEDHDA